MKNAYLSYTEERYHGQTSEVEMLPKYQRESKMFQALAHPVRLQILEALAQRPLCVCELVMMIGRRQAYISQHLALLRQVELVCTERFGSNVFYRVNAPRMAELLQALHLFFPLASDDIMTTTHQGGRK